MNCHEQVQSKLSSIRITYTYLSLLALEFQFISVANTFNKRDISYSATFTCELKGYMLQLKMQGSYCVICSQGKY